MLANEKRAQFKGLAHGHLQLIAGERLGEVVEGPDFHRLHGRVDRPMRRQHDHGEVRLHRLEVRHQLDAIHLRHPNIGQDEIDARLLEPLQSASAVTGRHHVVPVLAQVVFDHPPQALVVIDQEDGLPLTHGWL
jgi:hypothetical protein